MDYKQAGVNIEEGYRAVSRYRQQAEATKNSATLNCIGSFAGMFCLKELIAASTGMNEPVLVSGTDGVGTKLEVAFRMKKYDTVGIDCVAMCVNDVLCHGAKPLFFLDYIACGKLDADVAASLVGGVVEACCETGSVLLGGETAEMPGFYEEGKYDIAGFSVGIVDRNKIIDGSKVKAGDALLGIASSGLHSSGFSLIRKALPHFATENFDGRNIGLTLLEPTRLYVKPVLSLLDQIEVHGAAHITGGGFYENIPRMFGAQTFDALISNGSWHIPPIFFRIASGIAGNNNEGKTLLETDTALNKLMFNTFNMGIGFVIAVDKADVTQAIACISKQGQPVWEIGRVEAAIGASSNVHFA
ncbi:MAG: phosphoribosylformylglycinamidine cyclo-ligase [Treponema sp.]|jgi:phosphoribosylformylglycinamidine cyclo-ligase|nr:phosphoribosylformylglycinamidine cyclo-ligase [Treponema sp.]